MHGQVRAAVDVDLVQPLRTLVIEPHASARLAVGAVRVIGDDGARRNLAVVVHDQRLVRDVRVSVLQ